MGKIVSYCRATSQRLLAAAGRIGDWVSSRFPRRNTSGYGIMAVEDFPDALKPNKVYLAGDPNHYWGAALICPCGCGEIIQLNLLKDVRPCWKVKKNSKGAVTILPSIWRQKGCKCHFFVRDGKIVWA